LFGAAYGATALDAASKNTAGSATSSEVVPGFRGRRRGRGSSRVSRCPEGLACDKCGPMEGELGSQVVLLLQDVIDRCLPCQQGRRSPCHALHSSFRHVLTVVAPGGLDAADTQVRPLRRPYSDVARPWPWWLLPRGRGDGFIGYGVDDFGLVCELINIFHGDIDGHGAVLQDECGFLAWPQQMISEGRKRASAGGAYLRSSCGSVVRWPRTSSTSTSPRGSTAVSR